MLRSIDIRLIGLLLWVCFMAPLPVHAQGDGGPLVAQVPPECTPQPVPAPGAPFLETGYHAIPVFGGGPPSPWIVYSSLFNPMTGETLNNVTMTVLPLTPTNSTNRVLLFGTGYGDIAHPDRANRHTVTHDMIQVRDVIWGCLGFAPQNTEILVVVPHAHVDHINVPAVGALRSLGFTIRDIAYHIDGHCEMLDAGAVSGNFEFHELLPLTSAGGGCAPAGTVYPCTGFPPPCCLVGSCPSACSPTCVASTTPWSRASPLGQIQLRRRGTHGNCTTPNPPFCPLANCKGVGGLDLIVNAGAPPAQRVVIAGSAPRGRCCDPGQCCRIEYDSYLGNYGPHGNALSGRACRP